MGGVELRRDLGKSYSVAILAVCPFSSMNFSTRHVRIRHSNNHYGYNHLDKKDSLPEF